MTGDILLTHLVSPCVTFANKVEFITFFLQDLEIDTSQLIFNTLATAFLVSFHHPDKSGSDVLVWQEPLHDAIPRQYAS